MIKFARELLRVNKCSIGYIVAALIRNYKIDKDQAIDIVDYILEEK